MKYVKMLNNVSLFVDVLDDHLRTCISFHEQRLNEAKKEYRNTSDVMLKDMIKTSQLLNEGYLKAYQEVKGMMDRYLKDVEDDES